jgi:hypothetical protein
MQIDARLNELSGHVIGGTFNVDVLPGFIIERVQWWQTLFGAPARLVSAHQKIETVGSRA